MAAPSAVGHLADTGAYPGGPSIAATQNYRVFTPFVANRLTASAVALFSLTGTVTVTLMRNGMATGLTLPLTNALPSDTIALPEPYGPGDVFDLQVISDEANQPVFVTATVQ